MGGGRVVIAGRWWVDGGRVVIAGRWVGGWVGVGW